MILSPRATSTCPSPSHAIGGLNHDPSPAQLLDAVAALCDDGDGLAAWLDDLDHAEVAERSYWHHNGFAKLLLHADDAVRLRLHVWPAGRGRRGESNPHGHRWHFASAVLCGEGLASTEFAVSADGPKYVEYRYVGGVVNMCRPANTHLRVRDTHIVQTHARYAVTTDIIHTIDPLGTSLVATLVVQGPPRLASTSVYCAPGVQADEPRAPLSPGDVRDLVGAVLAAPDGPARGWR